MSNPIYRITLRALPQSIDPGSRLQRLLKAALREFGFRCKNIEEVPPSVTSTVTESDTAQTSKNSERTVKKR